MSKTEVKTGTFEVGSRPGPVELVVSMLFPHGVDPRFVPGGVASMRPSDFAAMLSGMRHADRWLARTAEKLFEAKYLEDARARNELVAMLHLWGCQRYPLRYPQIELSGDLYHALATLAVRKFCRIEALSNDAAKAALKIGHDRWRRLRPLSDDLASRLEEAEGLLISHLRKQLAPPS